jgi:hypothetical protein
LFKTRTPEEPEQTSSAYPPPTSSDIVFENLTKSFNEMNPVYYVDSFIDTTNSAYSFAFVPATRAQSNFPGTFTAWSKSSEQVYFENVRSKLQKGKAPSLELTWNRQGVWQDSAQYEATYQLVVYVQPDITFRAEGRAQFVLVMDHLRNWAIRDWIDFAQSPNDTTWSDLKAIAFTQW